MKREPQVRLAADVDRVYLHIDLDVLDLAEAPANQYAVSCGLTVEQVVEVMRLVREHRKIAAAALTAYDPAYDPEGEALEAGMLLAQTLAED